MAGHIWPKGHQFDTCAIEGLNSSLAQSAGE